MLWKMKQPKDGIYSVVQCIQFFIRMFGFWPFYIGNQWDGIGRTKRNFRTMLTVFWCAWSMILIIRCVYDDDIHYILNEIKKDNTEKGPFPIIMYFIFRVVPVWVVGLSTVMDLWNRNRIREIITKFDEFDAEVRSSGSDRAINKISFF